MPGARRIRVSGPAARDLAGIATYTERQWGRRQKTKYLGAIRDTFAALRDTPGIGTPRDAIEPGLRSHVVGSHSIYYRPTRNALVILRVLHCNMDPDRHLGGGSPLPASSSA